MIELLELRGFSELRTRPEKPARAIFCVLEIGKGRRLILARRGPASAAFASVPRPRKQGGAEWPERQLARRDRPDRPSFDGRTTGGRRVASERSPRSLQRGRGSATLSSPVRPKTKLGKREEHS